MCGHQVSVNNDLPQGFVLCPVLCNIYISVLHANCCNKVEIPQYANDFLIVVTGDSKLKAEDTLRQQVCVLTNDVRDSNCALILKNPALSPSRRSA